MSIRKKAIRVLRSIIFMIKQFFQPKKKCPQQLLSLIGDQWNLAILMQLRQKELRFCELQRAIDINAVTLTNRLKELENQGYLLRNEEGKLAVSYVLSEKGQQVLPVIDAIETLAQKI
jgi:DNA-binding HxlR family transcriptional regulator